MIIEFEPVQLYWDMCDKVAHYLLDEKEKILVKQLDALRKLIFDELFPKGEYLQILKECAALAPDIQKYLDEFDYHNADEIKKYNRRYICHKFMYLSNIVADVNMLDRAGDQKKRIKKAKAGNDAGEADVYAAGHTLKTS